MLVNSLTYWLLDNKLILRRGDQNEIRMRVIGGSIIHWVKEHTTDLWICMLDM